MHVSFFPHFFLIKKQLRATCLNSEVDLLPHNLHRITSRLQLVPKRPQLLVGAAHLLLLRCSLAAVIAPSLLLGYSLPATPRMRRARDD